MAKRKSNLWTSKKADQLFSRWVRAREPFCYFRCGRASSQASHFWGRGNSATRYLPENVNGACGKCHMTHEGSKQGLYRDLKIEELGVEGYQRLEKLARSVVKRADAIKDCMELLEHENS